MAVTPDRTEVVAGSTLDVELRGIDAFGNVHLCQGLVIGNLRHDSLLEIIATARIKISRTATPAAR